MSTRRIVVLSAGLSLVAICAMAASRNTALQIKILDSETRSAPLGDSGVPANCEGVAFDAYCRSSRAVPLVNTLVVQEGDKPPFRISCTAESRFSRCVPLPKGATFEARREKRGIVVYYVGDKGKLRSQLYTLVGEEAKAPAASASAGSVPAGAVPAAQAPAAPATAASARTAAASADAVSATAGESSSRAPAESSQVPAESSSQGPPVTMAGAGVRETVKCSFGSTPAGAEVTIDGRYVGSTPSVVGLTTGTHVVVVSMAGFEQWKRELAVTAGSELTVNAVLQKVQ